MMTTRRSFLAVGGAAAVAATLAACSSQSGKGSGSAAGGITLWTHNGGNKEELDVVNSAVKDFNAANPDTQVTVKSFPQESTPSPPRPSPATCPTSLTSTARSCRTGPGPGTSRR